MKLVVSTAENALIRLNTSSARKDHDSILYIHVIIYSELKLKKVNHKSMYICS